MCSPRRYPDWITASIPLTSIDSVGLKRQAALAHKSKRRRHRAGAPSQRIYADRRLRLVLQSVGYLTAILGELNHDLLVQPDVHRRRVVHVSGVV